MTLIKHSRPWITAPDRAAVMAVLRSELLSGGPHLTALERAFAAATGYAHAVAVSSGTAALELALLALGAERGSEVLVPSYVCVAALHAIDRTGARPRLVDLAAGAFHASAAGLVRRSGRRVRIAILPHLFGYEASGGRELERLGLKVIDDLAMGLGLARPPQRAGRIAVYSLYATKPIAAGEGGVLATDSHELAALAADLRSYDKRSSYRPRFNYKLAEMPAALACSQLARLPRMLEARRRIARRYLAALAPCKRLELPPDDADAAWYRFVLRSRLPFAELARGFARRGIEVARPVDPPLHRALGLAPELFPHSESAFLTALSLPIYPRLSAEEQRRVVAATLELHTRAADQTSGRDR